MGQSTGGDTYLMGALEAALGGGPDDGRVGAHAEERRRAQAVVRQVAEAMEERDDALDELDETLEQMNELRDRNSVWLRARRVPRLRTPRLTWHHNARRNSALCCPRSASPRKGR